MQPTSSSPTSATRVFRFQSSTGTLPMPDEDLVIVEEPLTIEVEHGPASHRQRSTLTVTMRTPGNDLELALGLAYSEGVIRSTRDVSSIREIPEDCDNSGIIRAVRISLIDGHPYSPELLQRHLLMNTSCGFCGRLNSQSISDWRKSTYAPEDSLPFTIQANHLLALGDSVRQRQTFFKHTGAVHAAATWDDSGRIHLVREDIGRHNAMDKITGATLASNPQSPFHSGIFFSGRTSFDLVQKSAMAGFPFIASVGAPSSLAIELARNLNITLVGFLKKNSFNIYSHPHRICL